MRFYYSDIQAFVTTKTSAGKVWNLVLGVCIAITLLLSIKSLPIPVALMVAGVFIFFLLLNILMGPTCKCYIQTAVNWERLSSLRRVRSARKVINKVAPLIKNAQGELTHADIAAKVKETSAVPVSKAAKASPARVARDSATVKNYSGGVHLALFGVLLLDGLWCIADIFYTSLALSIMGSVVTMGFVILMIIALVKQHRSRLGKEIRTTTWVSMAYACLHYVLSYVIYMYVFFQNPKMANNQWGMIKVMAYMDILEYPFLLGLFIFSSLASLTIGGLGMYYYSVSRFEKGMGAHP